METLAAELTSVSVVYPQPSGEVRALDDVTIGFPKASSTAIVGRSGSGKSTLISVLALLRSPSAGSVRIAGVETGRLSASARARLRSTEVGIVFQAFHLEQSLSATENVMLPWYVRKGGETGRVARARAAELLGLLGIGHLGESHPNQLSGGQRQRVAIDRALFTEPTLFIADEPTGNLDEETANEVADLILSLPPTLRTAVVLVTHDGAVAERSDRRFRLTRGHLSPAS